MNQLGQMSLGTTEQVPMTSEGRADKATGSLNV
jgi:hypothetical protein